MDKDIPRVMLYITEILQISRIAQRIEVDDPQILLF